MNVGRAIKLVRNHFGISQEDLSEKTGISQTSISQIETGTKNPSKKTITAICNAFEIPEAVLYIIGIDENDVPKSRKEAYKRLYPQIRDLAIEILGKRKQSILK